MSEKSKDDELDRMVDRTMARNFGPPHSAAAHAESIEPSSGFTASVMGQVRVEAARAAAIRPIAFPPIAFPWMRAAPGICMAVLAVIVFITMIIATVIGASHMVSEVLFSAALQSSRTPAPAWAEMLGSLHLGWLSVALAVAFVPLMISRSLVSRGHRT